MAALSSQHIADWGRALRRNFVRAGDAAGDWVLLHWLDIIMWGLGIIILGALTIPIIAYLGIQPLANRLLGFYHPICDQIPSHSFFICDHQVGICARCLALYGSIWLGTFGFRIGRRRIPRLPWYGLILFTLPMALDGGTQLFGWRESNNLLRVITGVLFGIGMCWFSLTLLQSAIDDMPAPAHHVAG
ncbi:MAG TPA: DUF2085 domain-containing protein [Ktedonobacterales bacterium]|nr:DUF2085 domain-containing protein [Ktedonobacterales bacterium]